MNYLDEMTIEYFQNTEQARNLYDTLQKIEKQMNKPLKFANSEYFGKIHATVYTLTDQEEFPSLSVLFVLHGEDVIDLLGKTGADFAQTEKLGDLDFVKDFSQIYTSLVDLNVIESEFAIIDKGIDDVICITKFSYVSQINQEKLAQMIVKEYLTSHFGTDDQYEYTVKVQEPFADFLS
ncbi:MAG TPA: hypothetical protein VIL29_06985 [Pseudothermotoga sp.]